MVAKVGMIKVTVNTNDPVGTTYDGTITGFGDITGFYCDWIVNDTDVTTNSPASTFNGRAEGSVLGARNASSSFDCHGWAGYASGSMSITNVDRANRMAGANVVYIDNFGEWTVTPITDGIRLTADNYTGQLTDVRTDLYFLVVTDCKCQVFSFAATSNGNNVINIAAGDGSGTFDADLLLTTGSMFNLQNATGVHYGVSRGAWKRVSDASRVGYLQAYSIQDAQSTSNNTTMFSTQKAYGQYFSGSQDWSTTITGWTQGQGTNQLTFNTVGTTNGDWCAGLLIENTIGCDVSSAQVNPVSLNHTYPTIGGGMTPKTAIVHASSAASANTITTSGIANSGLSISWKSERGDPHGSIGANTDDGVSTTTSSTFQDNNDVIKLEGRAPSDASPTLMLNGSIAFGTSQNTITYTGSRNDTVNYGVVFFYDTENLNGITIPQGLQDLSTGFIPSLSEIHIGLR